MFKWLGGMADSNEKQLRRLQPVVARINDLEPDFSRLSDDELRGKTDEFRGRLAAAGAGVQQKLDAARQELEAVRQQAAQEPQPETADAECRRLEEKVTALDSELLNKESQALDDLLPEAYAAVREAARRIIGQRHFDVQLMGGIVLHQGRIAEMKTGEGKTLAATLPLYLNSLTGRGCHLVTVNDYLAKRDANWMGPVYHALGVGVACIHGRTADEQSPSFRYDPEHEAEDKRWPFMSPVPRAEAYQVDITYGTNNEFGFDYLRDNMVIELSRCVQRPLHYAIVDEIDNLLIDEARTPLIISGQAEESGQIYQVFTRIASRFHENSDYRMSEKGRGVDFIEDHTYEEVEKLLRREGLLKSGNLHDVANSHLEHHLRNAIVAKESYKKDRDYVVRDGEVIIVDEFTGRLMLGRRYSEGLHQSIEAKERVKVRRESMTYATITFQNYFRMYHKLAGMTGTAVTEAEEFHKIYKLDVVVMPTNRPMIRSDYNDQIYKNETAKFRAVVTEVADLHREDRPVLIGTVSIEKSEQLSNLLRRQGIPHEVLNAKNHEKEAGIISQAGQPGAVTVATNMAGRGVDIILGGSHDGQDDPEWQQKHNRVVDIGGLHVIGTERHEARRIDNQLRGRAGRQGDPGSSRFYVSLDDDVVHRFGGGRIKGIMEWAGLDEDTPIENRLVNRAIENAQVRVEGYHFDIRKHLVDYDDVINTHREVIYGERWKILGGADLRANIISLVGEEIQEVVTSHVGDTGYDVDWEGMVADVTTILPLPAEVNVTALSSMTQQQAEAWLIEQAEVVYRQREEEMGSGNMRILERLVMLRTIDKLWIDHLTVMNNLRQGIGLQAMAQRDPLVAYKREGHQMFQGLLENIRHDVAHTIYHVNIVKKEAPRPAPSPMAQVAAAGSSDKRPRPRTHGKKVGRNDPCPCGSGKKYKHCCGR